MQLRETWRPKQLRALEIPKDNANTFSENAKACNFT